MGVTPEDRSWGRMNRSRLALSAGETPAGFVPGPWGRIPSGQRGYGLGCLGAVFSGHHVTRDITDGQTLPRKHLTFRIHLHSFRMF